MEIVISDVWEHIELLVYVIERLFEEDLSGGILKKILYHFIDVVLLGKKNRVTLKKKKFSYKEYVNNHTLDKGVQLFVACGIT